MHTITNTPTRSASAVLIVGALLLLASAAPARADTFEVGPEFAKVSFKVRNLGVAWVKGHFKEFEGTVVYDPSDPESISIEVVVNVASIFTRDAKRDNHLRSDDFFDAGIFPKMTFRSKSAKKTDGGLLVQGELSIRGHTKEVVLEVDGPGEEYTDAEGRRRRKATASAMVFRQEFGMDWKLKGIVVGKEVYITLELDLPRSD